MNDEIVEILSTFNIFDIFNTCGAIKHLEDLPLLVDQYKAVGNYQMAQIIHEWSTMLRYYVYREHHDSDENFYL